MTQSKVFNPNSRDTSVEQKYARIYAILLGVLKSVLNGTHVPQGQKYDYLKEYMAPVWDLTAAGQFNGQNQLIWGDLERLCREWNARPISWVRDGQEVSATVKDYNAAMDSIVSDTIAPNVAACDLVIDLGSGWGHRIFDIYRELRKTGAAALEAHFVACDRPQAALDCAQGLVSLFPEMNISTAHFDFLSPDFQNLPGGNAIRVGVFTVHAIEQIPHIGRAWLDGLFKQFPDAYITGVHVEPITHQLDPNAAVDRAYAQKRFYNMNLFELLSAHPAVAIESTKSRIIDRGTGNSSSAVVWHRKAPPP